MVLELLGATAPAEVFGAVAGAIAVLIGAVVAINRLSGQGAESLGSAVHELSRAATEQVVLMRNDVQIARVEASELKGRIAVLEAAVMRCENDRDRMETKITNLQFAAATYLTETAAASAKLGVDAQAAAAKLKVEATAAEKRIQVQEQDGGTRRREGDRPPNEGT